MLTVITPAATQDLATLAVVKAGLGITDSSEDATLPPLITRASAAIATATNRVLVQETVEQTFRDAGAGSLILDRYPVTTITTITEGGTVLEAVDHEIDAASGIVGRLRSDRAAAWAAGRTVIRYRAGYTLEEMPPDIVQALVMTVAMYRSAAARDPLLRSESTSDVESLEWQVTTDGLPSAVQALLQGHRRPAGC